MLRALGLFWGDAFIIFFLDKSRSSESFLYFLWGRYLHILLKQLLVPQYEVVCQYIDLVEPYGSVDLDHSLYATIFARLGMRWSQRSRWIKVLTSVLIIIIFFFVMTIAHYITYHTVNITRLHDQDRCDPHGVGDPGDARRTRRHPHIDAMHNGRRRLPLPARVAAVRLPGFLAADAPRIFTFVKLFFKASNSTHSNYNHC